MSSASEVLATVENNAELRQQLSAASNADEARKILSSAGVSMSDEQFDTFKAKFDSGEVSEDDLERVAGGGAGTWISATGSAVGASAAAAAAF
ncbi:MAG: Nif11-like leader peptide family RiPP precursor [Actinomycetota bacterium]|nr:Nif11-like leader peptide family RiPP precursor [Actinomycetota bacterium]